MKKIAIAIFAIGAVILVSGCAKKPVENQGQTKNEESAVKEESGGVISSIKDAMGLGKKMQCTYKYKDNEQSFTSTVYVDGKKYKGESEVMGKKQLMVFDGETMYMWPEGEKKGTKWTKSCMDDLSKEGQKNEDREESNIDKDETKDIEEAFKDAMDVKCTPVASIDFSVPSDIIFSDMCQELKTLQEKFQGIGNDLPSGGSLPDGAEIPSGLEIPGM